MFLKSRKLNRLLYVNTVHAVALIFADNYRQNGTLTTSTATLIMLQSRKKPPRPNLLPKTMMIFLLVQLR